MVYAFDAETNPDFLAGQLERLASPLRARVYTLSVERDSTAEAERKIQLLGEMLGVRQEEQFDSDFQPTYSDEVVASVDQYLKESGTDILALSLSPSCIV